MESGREGRILTGSSRMSEGSEIEDDWMNKGVIEEEEQEGDRRGVSEVKE